MDIDSFSQIIFKASAIVARELDALLDHMVADNNKKLSTLSQIKKQIVISLKFFIHYHTLQTCKEFF